MGNRRGGLRKSFGNGPMGEPACGLIIRRSGVRVPTPVLPELARRVPTIQATYGKPIKAGHPVPIRPFPALPEVRAPPVALPAFA